MVNICVWVLASAFGVPAMVMGNVEEEQEHNSKKLTHTHSPTYIRTYAYETNLLTAFTVASVSIQTTFRTLHGVDLIVNG